MRVIVIGSGIVGASATYHLADSGEAEVIVIDHGHPGKATLAGAGIICPWSSTMDDGPFLDLYAAGAQYYGELIERLAHAAQTDLGYRRSGALVVSEDAEELDAAHTRLLRRSPGRPEIGRIERVGSVQARSLFPPLRAGVDGIHISGGARVDGRLLADGLLDAASPARVHVDRGLAHLAVDGTTVVGVDTPEGRIEADAVLVAAGAWTAGLLEAYAPPIDVEPQKGQIVHLGLPDVDTSGWPCVLPVGPHYLVPFDDGRVVVGATRETGSGFDTRVTAAGQAEVLNAALSIAPGLADARIIDTRVGLRPAAFGLPTISGVPAIGGLFVGTGLGAAGLTIGPLAGALLADLVLDRTPSIDIGAFQAA